MATKKKGPAPSSSAVSAVKPEPDTTAPEAEAQAPSPMPHADLLAEKIKAGLTREQAEQVLKDQAEFDKSTKAKA